MRMLCGTILVAAIFGTVPAEGRVVGTSRMETLEFNTINKQPGWKLSLASQKERGRPL